MKKNNIIIALAFATISSVAMPNVGYAAEDDLPTDVSIEAQVEVNEEDTTTYELEETEDVNVEFGAYPFDDEVVFPKNEKNTRESDGTNKFNRATETERETFGEDKNVVNIDSKVEEKLTETNGEYGKKNGEYANNNLKAITTPIKNIVVNPGKNENEIAITWFAKGDVNTNSKLVFDGKEYAPVRARKTGDSNGYSTYTAIVNITPGKTYTYYVQTGEYKSEVMTLKTKALGENGKFNVAYMGDPQIGSGDSVWDSKGLNKNTQAKVDQDKVNFEKTIDKARELDPHIYLSMGDNVEIAGYEGEYDYFLDNPLFRERIFSTVMGNHETYMDPDDDNQQNTVFSDHFYLPNESELGSSTDKAEDGSLIYLSGDYYYTYGDTLFLMLNSNENDASKHEAFIKEAIKKATKDHGKNFSWKVVSFHHAPYSTATHTSDDDIIQRRKELVSVFNENGIDIVLNGHDHIYTRSKHMLAGEQALTFEQAYGTDPKDENSGIEDGYTSTYNNKVYKDGKVIVDGIGIDYEGNSVTNPRGTMFLTMSASAGAKFYNPIGEDEWFVNRSLDDRSQLFSNLSFSKNEFTIVTMDPYGNVVDTYTITKTDDYIDNPFMNAKAVSKAKLAEFIAEVEKLEPVSNKENIANFNNALAMAKNVLRYENSNQEEVDAAIEVLKTRLSEVEFKDAKIISNDDNKETSKEIKEDKKPAKKVAEVKAPAKAVSAKTDKKATNNPKTGIAPLTAVVNTLTVAAAGLLASKKRK